MFSKFIFFNLFIIVNAKYICKGNQTIEIDTEEVVFFETLNLPQPDPLEDDELCYFTFILNTSTESNKTRGIFALTNVIISKMYSFYTYTLFQNHLSYDNYFNPSFQGFVLFDDWGSDDCPMESISRINPYHFTDQTQIIQIQSTFFAETKRGHPCFWQFTAPKEFGFKFVFKQLKIASDVLLTVENSTDVIRTQYKAKTYHTYYNDDNTLKIYLSHSNQTGFDYNDFELIAQISIVLKDWKETYIADCQVSWDSDLNVTVWSLSDGYPNNAKCEFEYTVRPNKQVQIRGLIGAELGVDYVQFIDDKNETLIFTDIIDYWYFGNVEDDKIIKGIFVSDGSIQSIGFEIQIYERSCGCVEKTLVLNCFYSYLIIDSDVDNAGENPFQPYCFGLRCSFKIKVDKTCKKSFVIFTFNTQSEVDYEQTPDTYRIFSNGSIVAELDPYTAVLKTYTFFVSAESDIIFDMVTTSEAITQHETAITASASEGPKLIKQIILSHEAPLFLMDDNIVSGENGYYTVEVNDANHSETNTSIEMFSNMGFIGSFHSENFTTHLTLDKCDIMYATYWKCVIPYKKFAVYPQDDGFTLFRLSKNPLRGCIFKENVFQIFLKDLSIAALSNSEETCTIYVLSKEMLGFQVTHLWTTSQTKNIKVYGGINEKKLLFEFNAKTAALWKNILLKSPGITIEIPPSSSIYMTFDEEYGSSFPLDSFSQIIISTLNYGITSNECDNDILTFDVNENQLLKFTVFEYTFSSLNQLCFYQTFNKQKCVTHLGQEFNFTNISLALSFGNNDLDGCLVAYPQNTGTLLFVQVIDK